MDHVEEGAATSRRVGEEQIDGAYVVPNCKTTEPSSQARDGELQERLWDLAVDVLKGRPGGVPFLTGQG